VPVPSDDSTLRDDEDPLEPGDLDLALAPSVESSESAQPGDEPAGRPDTSGDSESDK
jgi:segregation and condensation protein B